QKHSPVGSPDALQGVIHCQVLFCQVLCTIQCRILPLRDVQLLSFASSRIKLQTSSEGER
ncbi:MAG TPA: hypothetical protein V6C65_00830, partial [Allocoleopsis sp.]